MKELPRREPARSGISSRGNLLLAVGSGLALFFFFSLSWLASRPEDRVRAASNPPPAEGPDAGVPIEAEVPPGAPASAADDGSQPIEELLPDGTPESPPAEAASAVDGPADPPVPLAAEAEKDSGPKLQYRYVKGAKKKVRTEDYLGWKAKTGPRGDQSGKSTLQPPARGRNPDQAAEPRRPRKKKSNPDDGSGSGG